MKQQVFPIESNTLKITPWAVLLATMPYTTSPGLAVLKIIYRKKYFSAGTQYVQFNLNVAIESIG